jgi:outer membrane protein assembly factor BamA
MRTLLIMVCAASCLVTAASATREEGLPNPIKSNQSAQLAKPRQTNAERSQLIAEAEKNQYWVRRVEFVGNEHIRDHTVRRRFHQQEGDVFTRQDLEKGLKSLSSVKLIYPVTINDVEVRLDREEKLIDFTIYFHEQRYVRRGSKNY